jgi:hypothetical protein
MQVSKKEARVHRRRQILEDWGNEKVRVNMALDGNDK